MGQFIKIEDGLIGFQVQVVMQSSVKRWKVVFAREAPDMNHWIRNPAFVRLDFNINLK